MRYAFTSFCFVNLCNREGFPAMPLSSEKRLCDTVPPTKSTPIPTEIP
ncbi:MAG: hypothetical protein IKO65_02705 [Victivallales bacterium]|nr:hypothetical protein [Victivallales bacterium]